MGAVGGRNFLLPLKRHIVYTTACCYRTRRDRAQDATVGSIGAPVVVGLRSKTRIILKLTKFSDMLTHIAKCFQRKYYCNTNGKSSVFNHNKLK